MIARQSLVQNLENLVRLLSLHSRTTHIIFSFLFKLVTVGDKKQTKTYIYFSDIQHEKK